MNKNSAGLKVHSTLWAAEMNFSLYGAVINAVESNTTIVYYYLFFLAEQCTQL